MKRKIKFGIMVGCMLLIFGVFNVWAANATYTLLTKEEILDTSKPNWYSEELPMIESSSRIVSMRVIGATVGEENGHYVCVAGDSDAWFSNDYHYRIVPITLPVSEPTMYGITWSGDFSSDDYVYYVSLNNGELWEAEKYPLQSITINYFTVKANN